MPSKTVGEDEITALYIAAVKRSVGPSEALQLDAAIALNPAGFALNKALLECFKYVLFYIPKHYKGYSSCCFFCDQGCCNRVIREDVRARVDTIHAMLGLAKGQALIRHSDGKNMHCSESTNRLPQVTPSASFLRRAKGLRLLCGQRRAPRPISSWRP